MAHQTSYEVHVKQNGRWEIHARHSSGGKEQAIEEAKNLDAQKHSQAVKVIQEIYDPEEGTSKEYNVYSPGQKKPPPKRKTPAKKTDDEPMPDFSKLRAKKQNRSWFSILLNISLITLFSTVVGGLFTWFSGMVLADTKLSENAQINILFIIFISVFVISAIPMAIVFLGKNSK